MKPKLPPIEVTESDLGVSQGDKKLTTLNAKVDSSKNNDSNFLELTQLSARNNNSTIVSHGRDQNENINNNEEDFVLQLHDIEPLEVPSVTDSSVANNHNVYTQQSVNDIISNNNLHSRLPPSSNFENASEIDLILEIRQNNAVDLNENDNLSSTDGSTSASSTTSSASASSIRRRRPQHHRTRRRSTPVVPETIEERRSIRQSLDAGMITLRRFLLLGGGSSSTSSRPSLSRASQNALSRDDLTLIAGPTTPSLMERQTQTHTASSIDNQEQGGIRQRALSEPEGLLRDFHFQRVMMEDRDSASIPFSQQSQQPSQPPSISISSSQYGDDSQQLREARNRWYLLNRRFHFCITIVAFIFSLFLFALLVCSVVLTSAYVVSLEKTCDIPLKAYFWLAIIQLISDVFRTDMIRVVCRWNPNNNNGSQQSERIPTRIICYHIGYFIYALVVLRLGIKSIYFAPKNSTCDQTATELYQSTRVFVTLSIAIWLTIIFGYFIPFCIVATLLTWNGYHPNSDTILNATGGGLFPATGNTGAPAQAINQFQTVILQEFPPHYPKECCICLTNFSEGDAIVATPSCDHVFHKKCCQEWLKHARTCPVCRVTLAPDAIDEESQNQSNQTFTTRPFPVRPESHLEIVNLFHRLRSDVTPAIPTRLIEQQEIQLSTTEIRNLQHARMNTS